MHIVVMGCGRVGSNLVVRLQEAGHSVAIIDQNASAFRRLGPEFTGLQVTGLGFDQQTLIDAGIERAGAFAAVSSGDNSNIIAARVARETFGVDHVVARIYDPKRAAVYERLGIPTVATVPWAVGETVRALVGGADNESYREPSGLVWISETPVDEGWIGRRVLDLEAVAGARVVYLSRFGEALLPDASTVLQQGDTAHFAVTDQIVDEVRRQAATPPEAGA